MLLRPFGSVVAELSTRVIIAKIREMSRRKWLEVTEQTITRSGQVGQSERRPSVEKGYPA